jgi:glycosyltransferase involved in cell wall biosynthesis
MMLKTSAEIYDKPSIGIITWAFSNSIPGEIILTNFINILEPLSNDLFVITGTFHENIIFNKKIHIKNIKHLIKKESIVFKIFRTILMQLRISFNLIKISKNADIIIFFLGMSLTLPMIFAKLLRKKTILVATGSFQKIAEKTHSKMLLGYGGFIFSGIAGFSEDIIFHLADQIAVESVSAIDFIGLNKYRKKISINGAMYMDTDNFKIMKNLKSKKIIIGYIGRLSPEKGVTNFAKAIPLILKQKDNLKFLIGGNGVLFDEIKNELKNNGSYEKVEFTGWIPHDELPDYLNELKLIILPSYSEGLPAIVQEGMACGAVVLATPVGGIPDLIKDGETGFILEDNSPECIAENVIRALEHPNLDEIVKNARKLIENEYSYEVLVRKCKDSLDDLMRGKREKSQ